MVYGSTSRDLENVKYPFHAKKSYRREDNLPREQTSISEDEFNMRMRKIMALEAMSGILDDLTPEQLEAFEASVKRRPLFKCDTQLIRILLQPLR